jgi:hypothetical protein
MTGSACTASAETGAGDAVVATAGGMKPRATDKTVKLTAEAHTALTTYAREARTDRKTVVSEKILKNCASPGVKEDLPHLIATINHVTVLLLGKIKKASEGETLELDVVRALGPLTVGLVHEIPRLNALLEKSSTIENVTFEWLGDDEDAEEITGK